MPRLIAYDGPDATPFEVVLAPGESFRLGSATAVWNGAGAGGAFLPCLSIYAQSGQLLARVFPVPIAAGGSAEVTYAPFLRGLSTAAGVCEDQLPSLCGGLAAGPIAEGSGAGSTLTVTLTRDVDCDAVIHIMPVGFTSGVAFPEGGSLSGAVDSKGGVYSIGGLNQAVIGAIAQDDVNGVPHDRLVYGPSAIRGVSAGDLLAGDTITLTWGLTFPANFVNGAMVFALTNMSSQAEPQGVAGGPFFVNYGLADSYPDVSASAQELSWATDLAWIGNNAFRPERFGGMVAAAAAVFGGGDYSPLQGFKLGQLDAGDLHLAASLRHCVEAATNDIDPGGDWTTPAAALVGNYQFAHIICST